MKKRKSPADGSSSSSSGSSKTNFKRIRVDLAPERVTELLKLCLEKVIKLQEDLMRSDEEDDPEAAGYSACVMETIRFLSAQGLAPDHPVVKGLTERLLRKRD